MTLENKKLLTVREMVIIGVAIVGWAVNNAVNNTKTDARLAAIEVEMKNLSESIRKDIKYSDMNRQALELKVQELSTSFQRMQLEFAEIRAKL